MSQLERGDRPATDQEALDRALAEGLVPVGEYVLRLMVNRTLDEDLTSPDERDRRQATFAARFRSDRRVLRMLHVALGDEVEEVRLYAAEALEHHDRQFQEAFGAWREDPSPEGRRALGLLYHRYAGTSFEPALAEVYHRRALEVLADGPADDFVVRLARARSALALGLAARAREELEAIPEAQQKAPTLVTLAEVHLALGNLPRLRVIARRLEKDPEAGFTRAATQPWTRAGVAP